mmetsp:Transcript_5556/g.9698  ORF Transcript_5556/g.9698 Transcript_5556/m.9698 type:complete len:95 (+) Transcript_5556:216-500(+)
MHAWINSFSPAHHNLYIRDQPIHQRSIASNLQSQSPTAYQNLLTLHQLITINSSSFLALAKLTNQSVTHGNEQMPCALAQLQPEKRLHFNVFRH